MVYLYGYLIPTLETQAILCVVASLVATGIDDSIWRAHIVAMLKIIFWVTKYLL